MWIYSTQLLNTMMIVINLEHILQRGLFQVFREDSAAGNASNILTILLVIIAPI